MLRDSYSRKSGWRYQQRLRRDNINIYVFFFFFFWQRGETQLGEGKLELITCFSTSCPRS
jgi:hypothetical protein